MSALPCAAFTLTCESCGRAVIAPGETLAAALASPVAEGWSETQCAECNDADCGDRSAEAWLRNNLGAEPDLGSVLLSGTTGPTTVLWRERGRDAECDLTDSQTADLIAAVTQKGQKS